MMPASGLSAGAKGQYPGEDLIGHSAQEEATGRLQPLE